MQFSLTNGKGYSIRTEPSSCVDTNISRFDYIHYNLKKVSRASIMAQYGKATYWDERYTKDPEPFDWYQRYSGVKDLIAQYVKKTDHILNSRHTNSVPRG